MMRVNSRCFSLSSALRPLAAALMAESYPGMPALWEGSTLRRQGDPVFDVTGIVIHVATQTGSEEAVSLMKAGRASWHWIVPCADEPHHGRFVWAAAPVARAARHLPNRLSDPGFADGRGRLNHATLAVLVTAVAGQTRASSWQITATAGIVRHAWARFPNLTQVACRSMLDPSLPVPAFDWEALRAQVTDVPPDDLPTLVARATPIALLDRPRSVELALRSD